MALGCLLAGGGMFVVNALLDPHVEVAPLAGGLAVIGFGLGLALVAVTASVLSIVPPERSGMAASTINTSRQLGGVLAVAILGAVVNGRLVGELTSKLTELGVPSIFQSLVLNAVTHGGLPANAAAAEASNPVAAANPGLLGKVLDSAVAAFGHGLHVALILAASILLAGAAVSLVASKRGDALGHNRAAVPPLSGRRAAAIRRTASASRALDVPKLRRAWPRPPVPKVGPGLRATRPRSRNVSAGSSPRSRARQSSQARYPACGSTYPIPGSSAASSSPRERRFRSSCATSASSHGPPSSNAAIEASTPKCPTW